MKESTAKSGFINPEALILLAIVGILAVASNAFIQRLRDSHPTAALIPSVIVLCVLGLAVVLATIESAQYHGWKIGLTIPIVIVLIIIVIAFMGKYKDSGDLITEHQDSKSTEKAVP